KWRKKPSYIPTRTFVLTLLDSVGRTDPSPPVANAVRSLASNIADPAEKARISEFLDRAEAALGRSSFPKSVDDFRMAAAKIPDQKAREAVQALIEDAQGDYEKLKDNLGAWFDGSMERVSGWYRRKVKLIILAIAIMVSFGFGVDTVEIGQNLWRDPVLRAALVKAAEERVEEAEQEPAEVPAPAGLPAVAAAATGAGKESKTPQVDRISEEIEKTEQELTALNVPRFPLRLARQEWCAEHLRERIKALPRDAAFDARKTTLESECAKASKPGRLKLWGWWLWRHFLGFFMTAAALSLGAPFWFDLLNKLVNLRSAGKRPEQGTQPSRV
ncbi:MAG TPA: hypothetical protein VIW92_13585, partial [Thermoanaerobaculia bacterium]